MAVVGPYVSACGGCDAIHPYTEIWPRVLSARARCDHVLYEGMAVSSSYGTLGRASEQFGDEVVFVFLDTPLSVCLERVNARRAARGADVANFDPHDIIKKWRDVQRTYPKIVATGRQVMVLDHRDPVPGLLNLLHRGYDRKRTGPPFPRDVPPLPPRIRLTAKERRRLGAQKTEDARSQGGGLFA